MFVLCSGHISRREHAQNQIWCFGYGYSECQEKSGYSRRKLDRKQMIMYVNQIQNQPETIIGFYFHLRLHLVRQAVNEQFVYKFD